MISILYNRMNGHIVAFHDYIGKPKQFSDMGNTVGIWHVPYSLQDKVSFRHDMVRVDGNIPTGTYFSHKSKERIKAVSIQAGGMWGLPNIDPTKGQETVLIARFKGLGDVLMSWYALEEYRLQYPLKHITYLTSPMCAALFCGQEGLVDKVLYSNYEHPATAQVPSLPISELNYDETYNMINGVDFGEIAYQSARADNFAKLLDIEIKNVYNKETDRYIPNIPTRMIQVSPSETAWARKKIDGRITEKVLVMQLNSNGKPRQWFYWNELAKLCCKAGYKVVFVSSDPQHAEMKCYRKVINLSCQTSIREYIAVLSVADVLVCCDTSGLHIGARIPELKVVPLFGSTGAWAHTKYYQNTYPIQGQARCAPCWDWQIDSCDHEREPLICMRRITPEMVMEKIKEITS